MVSNKRGFSDFKSFPGNFITINGISLYEFPEIVYKDSMNRSRSWKIFIRLLKDDVEPSKKINWDLNGNFTVKLKNIHYKTIEDGIIAELWTEQGITSKGDDYTITRSIPTYIIKGKNIGKSNETNVFTQALIEARSKYLKQKEKYTTYKNRFFPVAVHKYENEPRSKEKKIIYPCAVQRKLDGGRAVAYFHKKPFLYTRRLKDIVCEHVIEELALVYSIIRKDYTGVYLDGELYKHGLSLQQISGIMRRESDTSQIKLEFHVFDIFFPNSSKKFKDRLAILNDIFEQLENKCKYIKQVETFIAKNKTEETQLYKKFLKEKYEGSVIKNLHSVYEFGTHREIRTYQMRKRKPRYSDEFEIVGYSEGSKGKDKGAIVFILTTKGPNPILFNVTPVGIDYEERKKMFNNMTTDTFDSQYKGKLMTIEYDDLSDSGVPLRAKAKVIRTID